MESMWTVLTYLLFLHLVKGSVTNIARNKPASMSSKYKDVFKASTAVDGSVYAAYPNVIDTAHGQPSAWWKVDLERDVQDATVKIYFRNDYKFRRNGVQIYTSTTPFSSYPEGQLCHTVTGDPSGSDIDDVVSVTCPGRWRYLLVFTNTNNDGDGPVLDFGEVMVLVCQPGKYGMNCVKNCGQCNGTCDVVDGHCPAGCLVGYCGQQCKIKLTCGVPVSTIVGAVVGSVLVVVLVDVGILLCLIRQGRLQWVKVPNQNTGDNTQMRNLCQRY